MQRSRLRDIPDLPSAFDALAGELDGRKPAIFLDFDGVLAPIVAHASDAQPAPGATEAVAALASRFPVAVVSGRDRADIESLLVVEGVYYAGSHGFDISGPDGFREVKGERFRPDLHRAAAQMRDEVDHLAGVWVEEKRFAVAIHYREGAEEVAAEVQDAADRVASDFDELRISGGKKIVEIRPDIDWNKGRAVSWLIEVLDVGGAAWRPLYIGDDETDEDVFAAFADGSGVGIVVGTDHRPTLAEYSLRDVGEVVRFLEALADRI